MLAEIRRADAGLASGDMDQAAHSRIVQAYRRVIELGAIRNPKSEIRNQP